MRLYVAGPLFTQAERLWNLRIAEVLEAAGHDVFLPQTEVANLPSLDADTIFQIDVNGVRSADVVVAILDGADPDSGTSFECGVAHALGIPILAVRTDFRAGGDNLPGQTVASINLMLSQAVRNVIHLPDPAVSFESLAKALQDALQALHLENAGAGAQPLSRDRNPPKLPKRFCTS